MCSWCTHLMTCDFECLQEEQKISIMHIDWMGFDHTEEKSRHLQPGDKFLICGKLAKAEEASDGTQCTLM